MVSARHTVISAKQIYNTLKPGGVLVIEGVDKEDYYCQKLKNEGWNLINTAPTGNYLPSIGSLGKQKWNYEKCFEAASKYEYVKDFRKHNTDAYDASLRHGFLKDFNWLDGRKLNTTRERSYEDCKNIALKYIIV